MRNILESTAVALVVLLTFLMIGLIVEYNLIEEDENSYVIEEQMLNLKKSVEKVSTSDYLKNIEGYEDVQVNVDPTREADSMNIETVETEDEEGSVLENIDKAIKSAVEKMEDDEKIKKSIEAEKPQEEDETLDGKDPMDDIVSDIDSIINASMQ